MLRNFCWLNIIVASTISWADNLVTLPAQSGMTTRLAAPAISTPSLPDGRQSTQSQPLAPQAGFYYQNGKFAGSYQQNLNQVNLYNPPGHMVGQSITNGTNSVWLHQQGLVILNHQP